jgi:quercetin dioxygenase-like cupin family protein
VTAQLLRGFARGPEEGEDLWVIGGLYTYKSVGADNGNAYTLIQVQGPSGLATPHHVHDNESEGFYVASGEVTLVIGDQTIKAAAGSFAFAPRGVPHAFRLESPDATLLLLITPGAAGHEGLFREMGQPAERHELPPPPQAPPDFGRMAETASKHGTRIVGPPPGD